MNQNGAKRLHTILRIGIIAVLVAALTATAFLAGFGTGALVTYQSEASAAANA